MSDEVSQIQLYVFYSCGHNRISDPEPYYRSTAHVRVGGTHWCYECHKWVKSIRVFTHAIKENKNFNEQVSKEWIISQGETDEKVLRLYPSVVSVTPLDALISSMGVSAPDDSFVQN